jgi:hypothetical protein
VGRQTDIPGGDDNNIRAGGGLGQCFADENVPQNVEADGFEAKRRIELQLDQEMIERLFRSKAAAKILVEKHDLQIDALFRRTVRTLHGGRGGHTSIA